ncbi:hypothetical protein BKA66DRAFT_405717 [Pyrenochaeta sp. MPI-SDFR-AT-0127]|nr:hypothetical protein BKA66DRAFT_405717 [Pyrenochaeta sp. MPI-SDFR-AT-0127]
MATHSSEFLDVDEYEQQPNLRRSRSGGYTDHLEEQVKWDRRDRERQMKLYHDRRNVSSSQQRSTSDRLCVPVFETNTRRNRSSSESGRRQDEKPRKYNVEEVRPSPRPVYDYDLTSEPVLPSQVPARHEWKPQPQHQKKPSIKVQIHQDNPPSTAVSTGPTPKRSPSASPHSPTAQPQLQYQYAMLQLKLTHISKTCAPFIKVEAANPRDLTFAKIVEHIKGFAFDLDVWAHVANLNSMAKIDSRKRAIVEAASKTLDRLTDRVKELDDACSRAKPKDLKLEVFRNVDDDNIFDEDEDNNSNETDPTETPGFIIRSCLHSIDVQIGTLKRMSRSLQEATPDAKEEVIAIDSLVEEIVQYFGSQDALDRYAIDARFAGGKALDEARYTAAH